MSVVAASVSRGAAVEKSAREQNVLQEESVRRRGLREAGRTVAVLAVDASREPLPP